jgi:hypothetical protein
LNDCRWSNATTRSPTSLCWIPTVAYTQIVLESSWGLNDPNSFNCSMWSPTVYLSRWTLE